MRANWIQEEHRIGQIRGRQKRAPDLGGLSALTGVLGEVVHVEEVERVLQKVGEVHLGPFKGVSWLEDE